MLKEYIAQDINRIFKNEEEFSETVTINGVSVIVNLDSDRLSQKSFTDFDGVFMGDVLFFISAEEFKKIPYMKKKPTANDALMFNGKACEIISVSETMGMYEIALQYGGSGR